MWVMFRRFSEGISAGFPSPAEGYEDEPLNLHTLIVRNPAATFFYLVKGDVLRHEYLRDGSILAIDRSVTPKAGSLVLAEEDGDFIVCRFHRQQLVCGVVVAAITRF